MFFSARCTGIKYRLNQTEYMNNKSDTVFHLKGLSESCQQNTLDQESFPHSSNVVYQRYAMIIIQIVKYQSALC